MCRQDAFAGPRVTRIYRGSIQGAAEFRLHDRGFLLFLWGLWSPCQAGLVFDDECLGLCFVGWPGYKCLHLSVCCGSL